MLRDQLHITLWLMIHYHPCSKGWGLFVFGVDFRGSSRNRGQSNFTVCPITMNIYSKCVLVVANAKARRENYWTRELCVEYNLTTTNLLFFILSYVCMYIRVPNNVFTHMNNVWWKFEFFGKYVGVSVREYTRECRWVITCTLFPHIVALTLCCYLGFSKVEMGTEVNRKYILKGLKKINNVLSNWCFKMGFPKSISKISWYV